MKKPHIFLVFILIGFLCVLIVYLQHKTCALKTLKESFNSDTLEEEVIDKSTSIEEEVIEKSNSISNTVIEKSNNISNKETFISESAE